MESRLSYQLAADGLLVLHVLFILFVVLGLACIAAGWARNWRWTRNPWFRAGHLAAISIVVLQAWLGLICPLTTWEMQFRERAGQFTYSGSFIEHWLHRLIFYEADPRVFVLVYSLFGVAVIVTWIGYPPRGRVRSAESGRTSRT